jgi:hypothetical protein
MWYLDRGPGKTTSTNAHQIEQNPGSFSLPICNKPERLRRFRWTFVRRCSIWLAGRFGLLVVKAVSVCSPLANRSTSARRQIQIFAVEQVGGTFWNVVSIVGARRSILAGTVRITTNSSVTGTFQAWLPCGCSIQQTPPACGTTIISRIQKPGDAEIQVSQNQAD